MATQLTTKKIPFTLSNFTAGQFETVLGLLSLGGPGAITLCLEVVQAGAPKL